MVIRYNSFHRQFLLILMQACKPLRMGDDLCFKTAIDGLKNTQVN